jgi:hypothetical protein
MKNQEAVQELPHGHGLRGGGAQRGEFGERRFGERGEELLRSGRQLRFARVGFKAEFAQQF